MPTVQRLHQHIEIAVAHPPVTAVLSLYQGVLAHFLLPFPGLLTFRVNDFQTVVRIDAGVEGKEVREHGTQKINFTFADKRIGTYPQRGRQPANRYAFKQPVNRFGFEFFYGIQFLA